MLPLRNAGVGDECPNLDTCFVDAQGSPLTIQSTRTADVPLGDVTFREDFIVSDVSRPLIALGSTLRCGWGVMHVDGLPRVVEGDEPTEVLIRNRSLCAHGQMSVSQVESSHEQFAIRAVQLGMTLRCLVHGWSW